MSIDLLEYIHSIDFEFYTSEYHTDELEHLIRYMLDTGMSKDQVCECFDNYSHIITTFYNEWRDWLDEF